jgi:hypothetical protein
LINHSTFAKLIRQNHNNEEKNKISASTDNLKNVMFSSIMNTNDAPKSAFGGLRDS